MKRIHVFAGIALLCLAALCFGAGVRSAGSAEKPYPTHQITYMVCFDPGGQSDREARRQQPLLEKLLGQKVIVDYKIAGFNIPHVILSRCSRTSATRRNRSIPSSSSTRPRWRWRCSPPVCTRP